MRDLYIRWMELPEKLPWENFRTAVNLFAGQCVLISASGKLGLVSSQNEQGLFPESSSQRIHS